MKNNFKHITLIILSLVTCFSFAQERENDTIDAGTVNVVKPYTPKISDAFKVKETPTLNNSTTGQKKNIKYNIFSIPVASTFTPAKGRAASVDKEKSVKLYDNYASLGVGTYTTILGEVYLNHAISRNERVGGYFSHHSSYGDIEDINFDTNFSETGLNAYYSNKLNDKSWKVFGEFDTKTYNWYGLPDQNINTFDVQHSFYTAEFGGEIKFDGNLSFDESIVNNGSLFFRRFGDDQGSGENRFVLKAGFDIPIKDHAIKTDIKLDYLGGSFDRNYLSEEELKYGYFNFGIAPSYQMIKEDLTLNLGVKLVYSNNTEVSANDIFIYPNVTASYRLVDELLIAYGGFEGGLIQNSYYDFAQENPFVSPTLLVAPTDQVFDASVGIKGKLSDFLSYNVSGHYMAENGKALFKSNPDLGSGVNRENYQVGNSFGITYDDVTTFSFAGELNVDVNRNFKLGLKAEYFAYDTDNQAQAWNLPDIKGSLFLDYQIDDHWFAGANLFLVGERKDEIITGFGTGLPVMQRVTLDSFFDTNAHVGYRINDQLSAFAKANNIANQDYQRWLNYPVQSIQFIVGATYQFDF